VDQADETGDMSTDNELPEAAKYMPPQTILRSEANSSEEEETPIRSLQMQRSGPRMGTFQVDPSKAYGLIKDGKKIVMYKSHLPRRNTTLSGPATPGPRHSVLDVSPMISNSGNVMMSAMYSGAGDVNTGPAIGPPEAFYPFVSVSADGQVGVEADSSSFDEDDLEDDQDSWNLQDFLDFGDDDEAELPDEEDSSSFGEQGEERVHPLLEHFGRGDVGAFRRNQTRHALISRNVVSRDSLAFAGPRGPNTIRGIKSDRLAAANTSITPLRRSRPPKNLSLTPSSPAAAIQKRKLSLGDHGSTNTSSTNTSSTNTSSTNTSSTNTKRAKKAA
jgi:hypothetical protein